MSSRVFLSVSSISDLIFASDIGFPKREEGAWRPDAGHYAPSDFAASRISGWG